MQLPFFNKIKSPHIKKYAANTSWLFADNFIKQIVNLSVGIFLARYLSPAGLGDISYASAYMQILNPVALLGINAIAIKEFVNGSHPANRVIGTTFFLKLFSALLALILLLICAWVFETNSTAKIYIIVAGLVYLFYPFQVIDFFFQSQLQSKYTVLSQQTATIISAALKIGGILFSQPVVYFIWVTVIEILIISVLQLLLFFTKTKVTNWIFDRALAVQMLKESLPIIFTGFFIVIYMKVDQLMIQKMLSNVALGNFSAAVKLSEAFYVVPSIIAGSLFPAIINGLKISREEYLIRIKKLYQIFTLICASAIIFVLIFSDIIVSILYGNQYTETAAVLRLHFCNSLFVFFGVAYSQAFIVEGMQRFTTANTIIGAILNILLNLWLIPEMGVLGSALATLIAQGYSGFICLAIFPKTRIHFKLMLGSLNIIRTIKLYSGKLTSIIKNE